jgi:hypothetical protein
MALRWTAAGMMDAAKMVRRKRADREWQSMAIDNRHDFRAGPGQSVRTTALPWLPAT